MVNELLDGDGDGEVSADVVGDCLISEAFTETGFVLLGPVVIGGVLFDESVTLDHHWSETPKGFHPSLRQIEEWTAEIRRENANAMRYEAALSDDRSLLAETIESLASEWVA